MTWGEKIDTRLHAKDSAAQECMAIVRALAAERDALLQGLLKKSLEREEQIEKELSEARAQVAVLRKGMEVIADTTSHKRAVQLAIRFVATTPAEAAERVVRKLVEEMESTADDIGIEINNLQDVHNGIVQSAVHHLRDVASGIDKALSEWRRDKCSS